MEAPTGSFGFGFGGGGENPSFFQGLLVKKIERLEKVSESWHFIYTPTPV
jgi:hypothetical protein